MEAFVCAEFGINPCTKCILMPTPEVEQDNLTRDSVITPRA